MSLSLDFISKECRNKNHLLCSHKWEGFGFQIVCNCSCHNKKLVLGREMLYHDNSDENNVIVELNNKGEFNK